MKTPNLQDRITEVADSMIQFEGDSSNELDFLIDETYPHLEAIDGDDQRYEEFQRCRAELLEVVGPQLRKAIVGILSTATATLAVAQ